MVHRWPDTLNRSMLRLSMPRTTRRNLPCVTLCGLLAVSGAFAQPREDHSHFEVASIKPVDHEVPLSYTGPHTGDLGRIVISRTSLRELIWGAYREYGMFGERISGPPWIEDEYSVAATIPPGSTANDITQMFRNLLTERFGLKFHDVDKDVQGFELTIGQGGFKLTPSTAEVESTPSNPGTTVARPRRDRDGNLILTGQGTWGSSRDYELGVERTSFHQCSIRQLADMLTMNYGERSVPVIDKTEIKGRFDFRLVLPIPSVTVLPPRMAARLPAAAQMRPPDSPDASVIDLRDLSGSLEKQTGLRLKAVKLTLRAMVIDSVARTPTEN
jgi:uncharacterized protein (TIGR03435 family)